MKFHIGLLSCCLLLAGCSQNGSDPLINETAVPTSSSTVVEPTTSADTTESDTESSFERGSIVENVYTNESLNINIEIPDNFVALSDEQLNALVTTSAESKGIDNFQEAIESQAVTYDFGMVDPSGNGSVLVGIENLVLEGAQGLVNDANEYLNFVKAGLSGNANTDYTFSDIYDFQMVNDTWKAINAMDSANGVNSTIIVKYYGQYVASIIYNYTATTDPSFVLSYIY